jgi:hypothetical protein
MHRKELCKKRKLSFGKKGESVTKSKGAVSEETAPLKLLYLTTQRIPGKRKMPLGNW